MLFETATDTYRDILKGFYLLLAKCNILFWITIVPNPVVFSPDSIVLATGRTDGAIYLRNARQQEQIGILHGHTGQVTTIAFSADGETLVSVGMDSTIRFWSVREQKQIGVSDESVWSAQAGAISPDGKTLALYDHHNLCFLDIQKKEQLAVIEECPYIESIAFSPGSEMLASGHSDGIIRLWDAINYRQLGTFQPRTVGSVKHIVFNPDGKTLVSLTAGDAVYFWDVQKKRRTRLLEGYIGIYTEAFTSPIAFSPDSRLLALKGQGVISHWDIEDQERVGSLQGYDNYAINVAFSPDGKILVSNHYGGNMYIWDVGKQKQKGLLKTGNSVDTIAFSPDDRTLTSTSNLISPQMNTFILSFWDIQDKKLLFNIEEDDFSYGIDFSPDGQILASAHYGGIHLWDVDDQKQIGMLETVNRAFAVAFSPDGETSASAHYGGINLWSVDDQEQKVLLKSSELVFAVAFSPDGRLLAAGYNGGAVGLCDIDEQKQVGSLKGHKTEVMYLAFSPDGKWLASESVDGVIFLWKIKIQAR